jgi:hypothetical protein
MSNKNFLKKKIINKKKIYISLVLYKDSYIEEFTKYSFETILKNINNQEKNFDFEFLIATRKIDTNKITNLFLKKNLKIKLNFIENTGTTYNIVTKNQLYHLKLAKEYNYDFLIFAYADMLFSKYSFSSAFKIFNDKKINIITTFALLLNSSNRKFKSFFNLLKNKKDAHLKFLIKNKDIIDKYHQLFEHKNIRPGKSFIYKIKDNNLLLKSFHYHPIMLRIKNVNFDYFNYMIKTIDSCFLNNYNIKKIYVENNLSKISLFSYDKYSRTKNNIFNLNYSLRKHSLKKEINNFLLMISSLQKSATERHLFKNNTLRFPYNSNGIDFNNGNFNFINKNNKNIILSISKFINSDLVFRKSINKISIFFYFLFYFLLLSILFVIKPYQKDIVSFKKKFRISKSFYKLYYKESKNINQLIAFTLVKYLASKIYF